MRRGCRRLEARGRPAPLGRSAGAVGRVLASATTSISHSKPWHEAKQLLDKLENGWLLARARPGRRLGPAVLGRLDDAEPAARSSLERFDQEGEVLLVVSPLNVLARIAEARGDLHGASVAYEAVIERCRATGSPLHVPFILVALATLRARQGDDNAADGLYAEAIGCCFNPWLSSDAMVGQAAARRLGDLVRARSLLDEADRYPYVDFPPGRPASSPASHGGRSPPANQTTPLSTPWTRSTSLGQRGIPESQVLADSALAAAKSIAEPTQHHTDDFIALVQRRTLGPSHRRPHRRAGSDGARSSPYTGRQLNDATSTGAGVLPRTGRSDQRQTAPQSLGVQLASASTQGGLRPEAQLRSHARRSRSALRPATPTGQRRADGRGPRSGCHGKPRGRRLLSRSAAGRRLAPRGDRATPCG